MVLVISLADLVLNESVPGRCLSSTFVYFCSCIIFSSSPLSYSVEPTTHIG